MEEVKKEISDIQKDWQKEVTALKVEMERLRGKNELQQHVITVLSASHTELLQKCATKFQSIYGKLENLEQTKWKALGFGTAILFLMEIYRTVKSG